jgi:predicted  nucleic acid-binding Zn-ribbon protein
MRAHLSTSGSRTSRLNKALVTKLMDYVEQSLQQKIRAVETLIARNKLNLSRVEQECKKAEDRVTAISKSKQSKSLTEDIRLLFALAKQDRLDLVGKVKDVSHLERVQKSRSRTPNRQKTPTVDNVLCRLLGETQNGKEEIR